MYFVFLNYHHISFPSILFTHLDHVWMNGATFPRNSIQFSSSRSSVIYSTHIIQYTTIQYSLPLPHLAGDFLLGVRTCQARVQEAGREGLAPAPPPQKKMKSRSKVFSILGATHIFSIKRHISFHFGAGKFSPTPPMEIPEDALRVSLQVYFVANLSLIINFS